MKKVGAHRARHPVSGDASGWRRRLALVAGIAVGGLLTACLVIMAVGLVTSGKVPFTSWPGDKPPHREAEPGDQTPPLNAKPSPSVTKRPTPSPSPARPSAVPTRRAPATVRPSSTSPTTRPGRGHARWSGHPPHPKKS